MSTPTPPPQPTSPQPTAERHDPVMLHESLEALAVRPGGSYIDATLGLGGHAEAILEASEPDGRLLGIDRDPQAIDLAAARLRRFGDRAVLVCGVFWEIDQIAREHGFAEVDGVLFDLGVSSMQLDEAERGFSFQADGPLDMRMGPDAPESAAQIVNSWAEDDLRDILRRFGEEPRARAIASALVAARPINTTSQLVDVVEQVVGRRRERHIHPATLTFQALRIAVNQELDHLELALSEAHDLLNTADGRLVVIAFHSLEDRIVKTYLRRESTECLCPPRLPVCVCGHHASLRLIQRKVRRPDPAEAARNPRARSARLRAAAAIAARAA